MKFKKFHLIIKAQTTESNHQNYKYISTWKIAATYIGTIVGAGFASGQEVLQFFGYYGLNGFAGLIITTFIFIIYGFLIMNLGKISQASSYRKIIYQLTNKWLGKVLDFIITFFLFGTLTAMIAGSGAIFYEHFGSPALLGNILMVTATLLTALMGINGIVSAISFVVPLLLTGLFTLTIMTILTRTFFPLTKIQPIIEKAPGSSWILAAIVYASYNLIMSVAILAPLGAKAKNTRKLKSGSIIGGIGLGMGGIAILLTLLLNYPAAGNYEIPMLYIAGKFGLNIRLIYSLILLIEIYTTAVSNLYGFTVRLTNGNTQYYKLILIIISIAALFTSQFGFSIIIHYLYPVIGYAGLLLLITITFHLFSKK